jgi:lipopolysaccharide transport system ATP-binding protein
MPHIQVENLSVEFEIYGTEARSFRKTLVSSMTGGKLLQTRDAVVVRALEGVSVNIAAGERVGLIGHNGSGKTTFLRALAGLYHPKAGSISLCGTVGALLDPFAGIDGDATGLENIFLLGRTLGMRYPEIKQKLQSIVDMTQLHSFIDLPMRTYSAGMFARLSFAVSAAIEPDILLMDEGFGAGDAAFVANMRTTLTHLNPRSILVVASHDMGLIETLCDRVLQFERGQILEDRVVGSYMAGSR